MFPRIGFTIQLTLVLIVVFSVIFLFENFTENTSKYFAEVISSSDYEKENTKGLNYLNEDNNNLCRSYASSIPIFQMKKTSKIENILNLGPFKFHKKLKNPCFYQKEIHKRNNRMAHEQTMFRCLPYFYIIGFPKCATTDMWDRLLLHPQIVVRHDKESHYIDDKRFSNKWSFVAYLNYFYRTSEEILKRCKAKLSTDETCNIVTGEATANTAAVNDMWYRLSENQGCSEPRYTNPDYLYHINPNMKLIALVRDPVERLWSDYLYLGKYFKYKNKTSPEAFHANAVDAIKMFQDCLKYFTPRGCAYNGSIGSIEMRLRMGLYDLHIVDWLRVFPLKQLLLIQTEDYKENISKVLRHIFEHLEIDDPPEKVYQRMITLPMRNVNRKDFNMFPETKDLLYKFYRPYYDKLQLELQTLNS